MSFFENKIVDNNSKIDVKFYALIAILFLKISQVFFSLYKILDCVTICIVKQSILKKSRKGIEED